MTCWSSSWVGKIEKKGDLSDIGEAAISKVDTKWSQTGGNGWWRWHVVAKMLYWGGESSLVRAREVEEHLLTQNIKLWSRWAAAVVRSSHLVPLLSAWAAILTLLLALDKNLDKNYQSSIYQTNYQFLLGHSDGMVKPCWKWQNEPILSSLNASGDVLYSIWEYFGPLSIV